MEIKVYATLRAIVGGKSVHLEHDGNITVREMIDRLFNRYPALKGELLTRNGDMHSAFHILINGRDARFLNGPETVITPQDEVRIFPPVGGGRV